MHNPLARMAAGVLSPPSSSDEEGEEESAVDPGVRSLLSSSPRAAPSHRPLQVAALGAFMSRLRQRQAVRLVSSKWASLAHPRLACSAAARGAPPVPRGGGGARRPVRAARGRRRASPLLCSDRPPSFVRGTLPAAQRSPPRSTRRPCGGAWHRRRLGAAKHRGRGGRLRLTTAKQSGASLHSIPTPSRLRLPLQTSPHGVFLSLAFIQGQPARRVRQRPRRRLRRQRLRRAFPRRRLGGARGGVGRPRVAPLDVPPHLRGHPVAAVAVRRITRVGRGARARAARPNRRRRRRRRRRRSAAHILAAGLQGGRPAVAPGFV